MHLTVKCCVQCRPRQCCNEFAQPGLSKLLCFEFSPLCFSIQHAFWHSVWRSIIWRKFWHSSDKVLTFYFTFSLAFYLNFMPTFHLTYILTFCLKYILTIWRSLTHSIEHYILASILLSIWHSLWHSVGDSVWHSISQYFTCSCPVRPRLLSTGQRQRLPRKLAMSLARRKAQRKEEEEGEEGEEEEGMLTQSLEALTWQVGKEPTTSRDEATDATDTVGKLTKPQKFLEVGMAAVCVDQHMSLFVTSPVVLWRKWFPSPGDRDGKKVVLSQVVLSRTASSGFALSSCHWVVLSRTESYLLSAWGPGGIWAGQTNRRRLLRHRACRHHGQHCCCDQKRPWPLEGGLTARTFQNISFSKLSGQGVRRAFGHFHAISVHPCDRHGQCRTSRRTKGPLVWWRCDSMELRSQSRFSGPLLQVLFATVSRWWTCWGRPWKICSARATTNSASKQSWCSPSSWLTGRGDCLCCLNPSLAAWGLHACHES